MSKIIIFYEDQLTTVQTGMDAIPERISIKSVYPNPSNSSISFLVENRLPNEQTEIFITDLLGRNIYHIVLSPSNNSQFTWIWDGSNKLGYPVSSGVYIVSFSSGNSVDFHKVTLIK